MMLLFGIITFMLGCVVGFGYGAYIAMKTAQNNVVPWLASQTDVLATDWCLA